MLLLSRKIGEEIVIDRKVHVRITRVSGNRAFLAIEAPDTVSVDRREIWLAKERERLAAGNRTSVRPAGPEAARQSALDCGAGRPLGPIGRSVVRRVIPMLNRTSPNDRPEKDCTERDDHHQVLQSGVPLGDQPGTSCLRAAVHRLIAANQTCDGPKIEFWDDLVTGELPSQLQQAVLSIVREVLQNACRHSKSEKVLLGLAQDDGCVCVQVQDWGIGFASQSDRPHRRGLKAVRELVGRLGGTVDIDSERGKGTCVVVELPLPREIGPNNQRAPGPDPKKRVANVEDD